MADIRSVIASIFQRSVRQRLLRYLAACMLIDLTVAALCPSLWGDCVYGFFTLITYPVMLSGVFGVLLPRIGLRYCSGWDARLAILAGGGLLLGAIVVAAHAVAVGVLNARSYGEVFVETQMLSVELALAMSYYVLLSVIVFANANDRRE